MCFPYTYITPGNWHKFELMKSPKISWRHSVRFQTPESVLGTCSGDPELILNPYWVPFNIFFWLSFPELFCQSKFMPSVDNKKLRLSITTEVSISIAWRLERLYGWYGKAFRCVSRPSTITSQIPQPFKTLLKAFPYHPWSLFLLYRRYCCDTSKEYIYSMDTSRKLFHYNETPGNRSLKFILHPPHETPWFFIWFTSF